MKNIHDTIAIITCVLLFAASSIGLAQTGNDYVSTSELYEGRADIVAGVRIALETGFHATAGSMVHAFIGTDNVPPSNGYTPLGGDLVTVGDTPSSNRNYIKTTFLRGATTAESQIGQTARTVEVEYLNAFGNPEMTVLVKGSPDQKDLVSNILKYGIGGRVDSQYLPCEVEDDDGRYQNDIHDRVNSFYGNGLLEGKDADSRPFRQYLYDDSPLGRDAGYIGEGSHWASHPTHIGYKCNASAVSHWRSDATGTCSAVSYPAGSLRYEERADEDGRLHRVYTDNLGRKVREEAVGDNGGVLDLAATIVPGKVVDNVSSGLSKAIKKDLASNASATLSKEAKASMKHKKDVIDDKGIPGFKGFADFSAGLISGQVKKVIDPQNTKSPSSNRPPMILAPQKNDKAEQSIYRQIIYSK